MHETITKVAGRALVIWIGLLFAIPQGVCNSANETNMVAKIEAMVADIHRESDAGARIQAARELSLFVRGQERKSLDKLDGGAIDAIASLLRDKLDTVKSWAAIALGEIGPTASRAVPALESARKHIEPALEYPIIGKIGPSTSADAEIQDALEKIRGKRTEPNRNK
jgi:hypothetical protein